MAQEKNVNALTTMVSEGNLSVFSDKSRLGLIYNQLGITNKDEAIKKLVDFYLGQDNTFMQNTTKVNLTTNSDNTITISKTDEDSNTYYSGVSPLSDNSSDGLIITIENYDDSTKVYTYSLKNYSDVKSGNTSNILDNGTVPEKGDVTSNSKNK